VDRLLQCGPAVCALTNRVAQPGCSHGLSAKDVPDAVDCVVLFQHGRTWAMKPLNWIERLNCTSGQASKPAKQHIRMS
jgi:hypothetical protein